MSDFNHPSKAVTNLIASRTFRKVETESERLMGLLEKRIFPKYNSPLLNMMGIWKEIEVNEETINPQETLRDLYDCANDLSRYVNSAALGLSNNLSRGESNHLPAIPEESIQKIEDTASDLGFWLYDLSNRKFIGKKVSAKISKFYPDDPRTLGPTVSALISGIRAYLSHP